jgi:LysM repeat protein
MNNQSPLVPKGSLLDQKNKSRTRVEIAVFVILAIHGIGLLALLMQGCQKPPESTTTSDSTSTPPAFVAPTNAPPPPATNTVAVPVAATNTAVAPMATPETPPGPPMAPQATEYTIAQGDTFSALAKKFGVKIKAIEEANPGVDPAKLKIGQKIHIPAPPAAPTPGVTPTPTADATAASGAQVYVVKSGDMLSTIAKSNGVTVKALRAANDLKTDRITVGQKLKIPPRTAPVPAPTPDASATNSTGTTPSR